MVTDSPRHEDQLTYYLEQLNKKTKQNNNNNKTVFSTILCGAFYQVFKRLQNDMSWFVVFAIACILYLWLTCRRFPVAPFPLVYISFFINSLSCNVQGALSFSFLPGEGTPCWKGQGCSSEIFKITHKSYTKVNMIVKRFYSWTVCTKGYVFALNGPKTFLMPKRYQILDFDRYKMTKINAPRRKGVAYSTLSAW